MTEQVLKFPLFYLANEEIQSRIIQNYIYIILNFATLDYFLIEKKKGANNDRNNFEIPALLSCERGNPE